MIDPDKIPQFTGDCDDLDTDASALSGDAASVRTTGSSVHTTFQGLSAHYQAPEAVRLFATTKPVETRADAMADDIEKVSAALGSYATEVRPLAEKLKQLKIDAQTFVTSVEGDDEWQYDEDKVTRHNDLTSQVSETVGKFWEAERRAANAINATYGGTQYVANDGSDAENMYGYSSEDLKHAETPWGTAVEERHHWYEFGHWTKSFVWDGLIVEGVWGTVTGIVTLVNPFDWDSFSAAWTGVGQLGTGLLSYGGFVPPFWSDSEWVRNSRDVTKELGKSMLGWDEWGKNPGKAAGILTFNVLTFVVAPLKIGKLGEAGKVGNAGRLVNGAARIGRFIDPSTHLVTIASKLKVGNVAVWMRDVWGNLKNSWKPMDDLGTGIARVELPDGSFRLPDGRVELPNDGPTWSPAERTLTYSDGTTVHAGPGGTFPDGSRVLPAGTLELPNGVMHQPDGAVRLPDDTTHLPPDRPVVINGDGTRVIDNERHLPNNDVVDRNGVVHHADGSTPTTPDGHVQRGRLHGQVLGNGDIRWDNGVIERPNGVKVVNGVERLPEGAHWLPNGDLQHADGKVFNPDGYLRVTLDDGSTELRLPGGQPLEHHAPTELSRGYDSTAYRDAVNSLDPQTIRDVGYAPEATPLIPEQYQHLPTEQLTSGDRYAGWNSEMRSPRPSTVYIVDDRYMYVTDSQGRVTHAEGWLDFDARSGEDYGYRRGPDQRQTGGYVNPSGDAGGHLFAAKHFGAGEKLNMVALERGLNGKGSGTWGEMEGIWERERGGGAPKPVHVKIEISYPDNGPRPLNLDVEYRIADQGPVKDTFRNPEALHGKAQPVRSVP